MRCSHRSTKGQCEREALKEFTVCFDHADKESMDMMIKHLHKRIDNLKANIGDIVKEST